MGLVGASRYLAFGDRCLSSYSLQPESPHNKLLSTHTRFLLRPMLSDNVQAIVSTIVRLQKHQGVPVAFLGCIRRIFTGITTYNTHWFSSFLRFCQCCIAPYQLLVRRQIARRVGTTLACVCYDRPTINIVSITRDQNTSREKWYPPDNTIDSQPSAPVPQMPPCGGRCMPALDSSILES